MLNPMIGFPLNVFASRDTRATTPPPPPPPPPPPSSPSGDFPLSLPQDPTSPFPFGSDAAIALNPMLSTVIA